MATVSTEQAPATVGVQHDRYEWKVYRTKIEEAEERLNQITGYGLEEVFSVQLTEGPDGSPEMVIVARQHLDVKRSHEEGLERGRKAREERDRQAGSAAPADQPKKSMTRGRREMNDTGGY